MDEAGLGDRAHGAREREDERERGRLAELAVALHARGERAPRHEVHGEPRPAGVHARFVDGDDPLVTQARERSLLALEAGERPGVRRSREDLHGAQDAERLVPGPEDLAEPAAAELVEEGVRPGAPCSER